MIPAQHPMATPRWVPDDHAADPPRRPTREATATPPPPRLAVPADPPDTPSRPTCCRSSRRRRHATRDVGAGTGPAAAITRLPYPVMLDNTPAPASPPVLKPGESPPLPPAPRRRRPFDVCHSAAAVPRPDPIRELAPPPPSVPLLSAVLSPVPPPPLPRSRPLEGRGAARQPANPAAAAPPAPTTTL